MNLKRLLFFQLCRRPELQSHPCFKVKASMKDIPVMNHSMLLKHFSLLFLLPVICSWNICQTTKCFRCNFRERQSIWPQLVSIFGRLYALSLVLKRGWLCRPAPGRWGEMLAHQRGRQRRTPEVHLWKPMEDSSISLEAILIRSAAVHMVGTYQQLPAQVILLPALGSSLWAHEVSIQMAFSVLNEAPKGCRRTRYIYLYVFVGTRVERMVSI